MNTRKEWQSNKKNSKYGMQFATYVQQKRAGRKEPIMPDKLSFFKTFRALESAINITQQRHSLIAGNVSNLDTPEYRAKDIDFKTALGEALKSDPVFQLDRTHTGHIGSTIDSSNRFEPFEEEGEWNG